MNDINNAIVTNKKENIKYKNRKIIFISLIILSVILLILLFRSIYLILSSNRIYRGVYVDGINASGLSYSELKQRLEDKYKIEIGSVKLTLQSGKYEEKIPLSELNISFNIEATISKAFSVGREGNIFERLYEIFYTNFNDVNISPVITYETEKIKSIVESFYDKVYTPVKEVDITYDGDKVVIRSGYHGESIDKEWLFNQITRSIEERDYGKIEVPLIITNPKKLTVDELYNMIYKEPVDARTYVENKKLHILSHEDGRSVDKNLLQGIINDINNNEGVVKTLPLTLTKPSLTLEDLRANLFRDILATFKTYFSTEGQYNKDRNENLRLASEAINGIILAPGDVFSFNKVLGERTEEKGYKPAKIFSGGRVIDSVGGGICQVSSTLYNAVLRADLAVIERHNHSFLVSYLAGGYDAAVAYGSLDFQFKNSTNWPIKIESRMTSSNELVVTILGTNENPGKTVEFYTQQVSSTPYNTVYIDDPSLPEGTTYVRQEGSIGCVVDTYKIVKQNGTEVSRYKITTSVYIPLTKEIVRGTKKVENTQQQQVQQPQQQQTQEQDVHHQQQDVNNQQSESPHQSQQTEQQTELHQDTQQSQHHIQINQPSQQPTQPEQPQQSEPIHQPEQVHQPDQVHQIGHEQEQE